jgi:hypothetical protein
VIAAAAKGKKHEKPPPKARKDVKFPWFLAVFFGVNLFIVLAVVVAGLLRGS